MAIRSARPMHGFFTADGMSVALLNFKKILDLCGDLGPIEFNLIFPAACCGHKIAGVSKGG